MSAPTSCFGFLSPPTRRLRARRRSVFVAELLDARLLLSGASAELPAVSAATPAEPASDVASSPSALSGEYETAEHVYPAADDLMNSMMGGMMTDMMSEMNGDTSDEMPVMMMTENTMLLSPAVTAPEFRGPLFDAADAEAANILRVDPDADDQDRTTISRPARSVDVTTSPVTRSESAEVSVEPSAEADPSEADSGTIPDIELLPAPEELPDTRRDAEESGPDARSATEEQADDNNDGQRLPPSEQASAADAVPVVSLVQPTRSLASRITGLEIPSLDELFSHGYQLAVEGPALSAVSIANDSPVDE